MHLLPGDTQGLERVDQFDVDALAAQLESVGAKYFVLTLGQNSGFMNSPNPTYEQVTGYQRLNPFRKGKEKLCRMVAKRPQLR